MSRDKLTLQDRTRIQEIVAELTTETLEWYYRPDLMINVFGMAMVPAGDVETTRKRFSTEEGLLSQVDSFSTRVGFIFFLRNDRGLHKMSISLER